METEMTTLEFPNADREAYRVTIDGYEGNPQAIQYGLIS
jgi:hypothetical protein